MTTNIRYDLVSVAGHITCAVLKYVGYACSLFCCSLLELTPMSSK